MDASTATLVTVDDAARWNQFAAAVHPSAWQQSWAYGTAAKRAGRTVERLCIDHAGETVGIVQLVGRTACGGRLALRHALGGPGWLGTPSASIMIDGLRALRRHYRRLGQMLLLTPCSGADPVRSSLRAAGLRRVMTGYTTAHLPLLDDAATQARLLRPSWRRTLKRPRRELKTTYSPAAADPLALAAALSLHETGRRRRGYACVSTDLVAHAARYGDTLLATAQAGGTMEAFMLFVVHGSTATYQVGWSSPRGRKAEAHHHLLWGALGRLRDKGCRTLDLGGLNLPAGIVAFKLATGAEPVTFAGTFA